jgi:tetratricopeptide (TPR) repeat protein
MFRSTRLAFSFALLMFPWNDLQAAKVFVKFVDRQDKPLKEVEAKLVHMESGKDLFLKARAKTELEFEASERGNHQLMAQRKGFLTVKSDPFAVEERDVTLRIRLVELDKFREIESAAKAAFDQGQYPEALQRFQELNALVPTEPVTWSNLARCHAMLRQRDQALEAVRKASAYDPGQFGADFEKSVQASLSFEEGAYYLEQHNYAKAVEALTRALELDSTKAETFYSLALAYGQQKKYAEALKNIDLALKLKPGDTGFLEVQRILKQNAEASAKR